MSSDIEDLKGNQMNIDVWQQVLTSKISNALSWVAAFLGIGTLAGLVNLAVGLLSSFWLATQLWHHYKYVRPKAILELKEWEALKKAKAQE